MPPKAVPSEREAEFAEQWLAGVPAREMSETFDIGLPVVSTTRERLGLPARPHGRLGRKKLAAYMAEKMQARQEKEAALRRETVDAGCVLCTWSMHGSVHVTREAFREHDCPGRPKPEPVLGEATCPGGWASVNGYTYHGCRCAQCSAAKRETNARRTRTAIAA